VQTIQNDFWLAEGENLNTLKIHLLKQHEHHVLVDQTLSWEEFQGSAIALSSFSFPDTQVALNLPQSQHNKNGQENGSWVQVESSPTRITYSNYQYWHQQWLQDIALMGATQIKVVSVKRHGDAYLAPARCLLQRHELTTLQHWAESTEHANSWRARLKLAGLWYWKAGRKHQQLRIALSTSAVVIFLTCQLYFQHKQTEQKQQWLITATQSIQAETNTPKHPHWNNWQEQLQKFGKEKRANIKSLTVNWNQDTPIHTWVELNKPRKRLPKGCDAHSDKWVSCRETTSKNRGVR
jgi:hypothetical protein